MRGPFNRWRLALRILCAAAILALGFGHKPVAMPQLSPPELAAYALPDGSVPEICLPGGGDGKGGTFHAPHGCEACVIGSAVLLPSPVDVAGQPIRIETAAFAAPRIEAVYHRLFPPNAAPRAPPARQLFA